MSPKLLRTVLHLVVSFLATSVAVGEEPLLFTVFPKGFGESQLLAINEQGTAVGKCEIYNVAGNAISIINFTFSSSGIGVLPNATGYRHMELCAISNGSLVTGHAYGPMQKAGKALQAIAIDRDTGRTFELPLLVSTQNSIATAISADGNTIAGICSGRPCTWTLIGDAWVVSDLIHDEISCTRLVLSPNGKVAACAARHLQENVLLVWQYDGMSWSIHKRIKGNLSPYAVNDHATTVGAMNINIDGAFFTRGFVLREGDSPTEIPPFPEDNFSIARAVNNLGVVVGWSDCVGELSKQPRGLKWVSGEISELLVGGSLAHQAYAINDRGDIAGLLELEGDTHSVGFILYADKRGHSQ